MLFGAAAARKEVGFHLLRSYSEIRYTLLLLLCVFEEDDIFAAVAKSDSFL